MHIRKAVITAAGRGVRLYPTADTVQKGMLPVVDRDGLSKPVIQIIAEEALASGIEEICLVCAPGDETRYVEQFRSLRENLLETHRGVDWAEDQAERISRLARSLSYVVQDEPLGYGHSVYCAKDFVGDDPFLLLLGDHLYVSDVAGQRCAQQVMRLADEQECAVAAVQATREHLIGRYGTLSGKHLADYPGVYQIEQILEKPALSVAEVELHTSGLRTGHYLCFFGMHVLPPSLLDILGSTVKRDGQNGAEIPLTPALQELASREKYLALEVRGTRYDIGAKFGLLQAQVALAMDGEDRDQVLTTIVDLLAEAHRRQGPRCHG